MAAIVTTKLRTHNAALLENEWSVSNQYFFLAIGKQSAWSDEAVPDTTTESFETVDIGSYWRDMIAAKRIATADVETTISRINWSTGTVYDMYDHTDTALFTKNFYVMTTDFNVYKCIRNGEAIDAGSASTTQSTVKPDHTTPNTTPLESDGYQWRYLYTISTADIASYLVTDWMPVMTTGSSAVDTSAGTVHVCTVTAQGSGYTNGTVALTVVSGDGSGFEANATISGGIVTDVVISNGGSGYTQLTLSLTSGSGTGATFKPIFSPGGKLTGRGHGYSLEKELGGFYRIMNVKLEFGESTTISTANDYRRIMIIKNPYLWGTTSLATGTNYRQTQRLTVGSISGTFTADEVVTGGSSAATAKVVEWDTTNSFLYLNDSDVVEGIKSAWTGGETLTGGSSGATATYTDASVDNPDLEPGSGDMMYVENRVAITRATDQTEDFKIIIES